MPNMFIIFNQLHAGFTLLGSVLAMKKPHLPGLHNQSEKEKRGFKDFIVWELNREK